MIVFRRTPLEEVRNRHPLDERAKQDDAPKRSLNVREVLDLGGVTYFSFRGRQYGVPPLPWREGQDLLDAYLTVRGYPMELRHKDLPGYYKGMERLARIMWRNCRPLGLPLRAIKALRLLRNPFRLANETQVAQLSVFFLGCRTKSDGSFRPVPAPARTS